MIGYLRWPQWKGTGRYDKCACSLTSGVFPMLEPLRYSANYHTGPWDVSSSDRRVLQRRPLSSYQCWSVKRGNRQKRGLAIFIPSPEEAFSKKGMGPSFQTEKKPGKAGNIRSWELRVWQDPHVVCSLPVLREQGEGMLESEARGWTLHSVLLKMFNRLMGHQECF